MNSAQVHLALNHVPVLLSLVGLIILVISWFIKNNTLLRTSYIILIIAGIAAVPVYLTGEGTEEIVEKLPGVSDSIIEEHEEVAKFALFSIAAGGLLALAAIFVSRWNNTARVFKIMVLLVAFASGGLMLRTAHLGGQIRHTEIRNGFVQNNNGGSDNIEDKQNRGKEED